MHIYYLIYIILAVIFTYYLFILLIIFNWFILIIFFISVLADSNRVPYDLPEAESELIAGFITEFSTIYFSLILLTEYTNIIILIYFNICLSLYI